MIERIEQLKAQAEGEIAAAGDSHSLEELRVRYLGRKAELPQMLRGVAGLEPARRGEVGKAANEARQALDKLGVDWEPTEAERAYNEGRSTQVPVNPVVRVKSRFSRQLRYRDTELVLER